MRDRLTGAVSRGSRTFGGFTAGQKAVTLLGVAALVLGAVLFTQWAARPAYAPLFSNLAAADASAIVDKLTTAKTPYQLADGGATILVPRDKVYALRLQMSGQGLPAGNTKGYSLLDKQGITTSDFRQRVDYQRALEGELTKTIAALDGVRSAVVHLAIPQRDVFATAEQKPTASVLVQTAPGKTLTGGQVQAVVNLVASSVVGMSPDQVTIADASGKVLSTAGGNGALAAAGDTRAQQTQAFEDRMAVSLQDMLDRVVGPGHAVVRVTAALDFDQTRTTTERFLPPDKGVLPLADTTTTETYVGGGTPVGGVLGPDNIAVPNPTSSAANQYKKDTATRNNAVGKVTEVRKSAPGAVRRLNVAVLLDATTAGAVQPTDVSTLVSSAVGADPTRGDTVEVSRLPFSTAAAEAAKADLAKAAQDASRANLFGLAKTGGLVLVTVLILLVAWLSARRRRGAAESAAELRVEEVARLLESANAARAVEGGGGGVPALEGGAGPGPAERTRAVRDEIGQLVERQPDEVAQLLRGWLADRRA